MSETEDFLRRYARNISLPQIGKHGQELLTDAKVLIIGAGGLGSPVAMYLAASGVGNIGIIDGDQVELSNLQRQLLFTTADIGKSKAELAKKRLLAINPNIEIIAYNNKLNSVNAKKIISNYDIVADGSDNFSTRFLVNQVCFDLKKTLVSGAVSGFSGQIATFKAYINGNPCYRCFCPDLPPDAELPICIDGGVLGPACGIIASIQATEVIKEILSIGDSLSGFILIYNSLNNSFRKIILKPNHNCVVCGTHVKQVKYAKI